MKYEWESFRKFSQKIRNIACWIIIRICLFWELQLGFFFWKKNHERKPWIFSQTCLKNFQLSAVAIISSLFNVVHLKLLDFHFSFEKAFCQDHEHFKIYEKLSGSRKKWTTTHFFRKLEKLLLVLQKNSHFKKILK